MRRPLPVEVGLDAVGRRTQQVAWDRQLSRRARGARVGRATARPARASAVRPRCRRSIESRSVAASSRSASSACLCCDGRSVPPSTPDDPPVHAPGGRRAMGGGCCRLRDRWPGPGRRLGLAHRGRVCAGGGRSSPSGGSAGVRLEPQAIRGGRYGRLTRWPAHVPEQARWVKTTLEAGFTVAAIAAMIARGEFLPET